MNKIEQASWLGQREAGLLKSLCNYRRVNVGKLLDGAYLGGSGEEILRTYYYQDSSGVGLGLYGNRDNSCITAFNPGIKIVESRFLQSEISGDVLAVLEGKNFHVIQHDEAEDSGLLVVKGYQDIFTYCGMIDARGIYGKARQQEDKGDCLVPVPVSAYQVTKKGNGRIFLLNKENISL